MQKKKLNFNISGPAAFSGESRSRQPFTILIFKSAHSLRCVNNCVVVHLAGSHMRRSLVNKYNLLIQMARISNAYLMRSLSSCKSTKTSATYQSYFIKEAN